MKGGTTASGYTIVEVMIFLAVSGALFVLAMLTINGQQAKAAFAQGTRDFQSSMEDIINDTRNGNFPEKTKYTCDITATGEPDVRFVAAGTDQGTHEKCIFLGKVIQFSPNSDRATIYSVIGRRTVGGQEVTTYSDAKLVAAPTDHFNESFTLSGGLTVTSVMSRRNTSSGPVPIAAVAFFSSLTNYTADDRLTNDNLITVIPMTTTTLTPAETVASMTGKIAALSGGGSNNVDAVKDPDVVVICLSQGSADRRAALSIGGNGSRTTTELHIGDIDNNTTGVPHLLGAGVTCPA